MAAKAAKARASKAPATVVWLTRQQAATRSGLTVAGVRGRVRLGLLTEYKDGTGKPRYDAAEVDALARKKPVGSRALRDGASTDEGALASRAFALFAADGIDLRKAVVQLNVTLEVADRLARDYARAGGEVLLLLRRDSVSTLRSMIGWDGADEDSLTRAVAAWMSKKREAHSTDIGEREGRWAEERAALEASAAAHERRAAELAAELEAARKRLTSTQHEAAALRETLETTEAARAALDARLREREGGAGTAPPTAAAPAPTEQRG